MAKVPEGVMMQCAWCGKLFTPKNGQQRYCTVLCKREHDKVFETDRKRRIRAARETAEWDRNIDKNIILALETWDTAAISTQTEDMVYGNMVSL